MAVGWAKDGAVQDQIDAGIQDAVQYARNGLPTGQSCKFCQECGKSIPEARQRAVPGVRLCVQCQSVLEQNQSMHSTYNRRGSKDSQLR